jgi:hypothetical protein
MDSRQTAFVAAAIEDELVKDGVRLPPERLSRLGEIAAKAAVTWMIGAAQEGMIDAVHVGSEDPRDGQ